MSANTSTFDLPWKTKGSDKRYTVAVIGDIILDEYLDGRVDRISPEAPVPVHLVSSRTYTPGGAANAARNIRLAGGQAKLFSVAGNDEAFGLLKTIFDAEGIPVDGIITTDERPTIRKTRVTTQSQQLVRIDWERVFPISEEQQDTIFQRLEDSDFDAILISDYGKGALPDSLIKRVVDLGKKRSIPVIVDPKGTNFEKYSGATLIKPNHKEACEALGIDPTVERDGETLSRLLNERFGFSASMVTLGSRGMVLMTSKGEKFEKRPQAREVYDVSGAGDTVAAMISLSAACQTPWEDAVDIANIAAGIVVEKWGTQPVYETELINALNRSENRGGLYSSAHKIIELDSLKALFNSPKYQGKRMVFTNGCFDILHAGHLTYLEKSRAKGDFLVVGLNSDASIKRLKGQSRPIVAEIHRKTLLAGLGCVDFVVVFDEDTPLGLIEALSPAVLIKGSDWNPEEIVGANHVLANGGSVETVDLVPELSTSKIIDTVIERTVHSKD